MSCDKMLSYCVKQNQEKKNLLCKICTALKKSVQLQPHKNQPLLQTLQQVITAILSIQEVAIKVKFREAKSADKL